jgi:mycoketide-CoA synthase
VRAEHGVGYQAFDLLEKGPEHLGRILAALSGLFADGVLSPVPVTCWDVRRAPEAFRYLSQGRNIGKIALTLPTPARTGGTTLVTGAGGALGRLVARHVVDTRRAERVVLASRGGPATAGTARTAAALAGAGAQVRVVSCDVADRAQSAALITGLTATGPLTGVVHAAGVLDDGLLGTMTARRMADVMRPKVDGARHLDELTRHLDLDSFVLFSSVAGIWGSPGQGNYAAANTYLDALAAHRRGQGLPGVSMAWGPWQTGMAAGLSDADRRRLAGQGLTPLSDTDGLALFDAATGSDAMLVAARLDVGALPAGQLPPLLSGLARRSGRPGTARPATATGTGPDLATRLATQAPDEQHRTVLRLLTAEAAAVLGMAGADAIDGRRSFQDLGFDSLTAMELRNRLVAATGLELTPTMIFDHPTPDALAASLRELAVGQESGTGPVLAELDRLGPVLRAATGTTDQRAEVVARLERLVADLRAAPAAEDDDEQLDDATDDEMFDLIDRELGISG